MAFSINCSFSNSSLTNSTDCNEDLFNCSASNTSRRNWTNCLDLQPPEMEVSTQSSQTPVYMIQLLLFSAMVVGNSLVLAAVRRLQNHRVPIHYWVSLLAVTDIILAVAVAIRTFLSMFSLQSYLSCKVIMCFVVTSFYVTMTGVLSMSFISWQSMQRLQLTSNTFHRSQRHKHLVAIAVIWIGWSVVSVRTIFGNGQAATLEKEGCYAFSSFSSSSSLAMFGIVTLIHIVGISVLQCGLLYQLKRAQTIIYTGHQPNFPLRNQVGLRTSDLEVRTSGTVQLAEGTSKDDMPRTETTSLSNDVTQIITQRVQKAAINNARLNTRHIGKYASCVVTDLQLPHCSYHTGDSVVALDGPNTLTGRPKVKRQGYLQDSMQNKNDAILHPVHTAVESADPSSIDETKTNKEGFFHNSVEIQSNISSRATEVGDINPLKQVSDGLKGKTRRRQIIKTKDLPHPICSRRNIHLTKSVILVIALFVACYLPCAIYMVMYGFYCSDNQGICSMPVSISIILNTITSLNSILNPLVWAFRSREFKRVMKDIIKCPWRNPFSTK